MSQQEKRFHICRIRVVPSLDQLLDVCHRSVSWNGLVNNCPAVTSKIALKPGQFECQVAVRNVVHHQEHFASPLGGGPVNRPTHISVRRRAGRLPDPVLVRCPGHHVGVRVGDGSGVEIGGQLGPRVARLSEESPRHHAGAAHDRPVELDLLRRLLHLRTDADRRVLPGGGPRGNGQEEHCAGCRQNEEGVFSRFRCFPPVRATACSTTVSVSSRSACGWCAAPSRAAGRGSGPKRKAARQSPSRSGRDMCENT